MRSQDLWLERPGEECKIPRERQALGGTGGFLCLNQGPGGSICLQIHSPCPRGGPGVRYRQMALWHSFPTPFSSWESECSVFERQATLVFSWVLSRRWGIKVAEEPVSCPRLCPRPGPEQKCWRLWDPQKPGHSCSVPEHLCPKLVFVNNWNTSINSDDVTFTYHAKNLQILLVSVTSWQSDAGTGLEDEGTLAGDEMHTSVWCAAVSSASLAERTSREV